MGCMQFGMGEGEEHNECDMVVALEHMQCDKGAVLECMPDDMGVGEVYDKLVHMKAGMAKHMVLVHILELGSQLFGKGCKQQVHMRTVCRKQAQPLPEPPLLAEQPLRQLVLIEPLVR